MNNVLRLFATAETEVTRTFRSSKSNAIGVNGTNGRICNINRCLANGVVEESL